jgi:hypothetical protein
MEPQQSLVDNFMAAEQLWLVLSRTAVTGAGGWCLWLVLVAGAERL